MCRRLSQAPHLGPRTIVLAISPTAENLVWRRDMVTSASAGRTLKARPPAVGGDWGGGSFSCTRRSRGGSGPERAVVTPVLS